MEMIRARLLLFAMLVAFVPAVAFAQNVSKEAIISDAKKRTYYIYLPEKTKGAAPLLVLLHCSNHNGLSLVE